MTEKSFDWSEHAVHRLMKLRPGAGETEHIQKCMSLSLQGKIPTEETPADDEFPITNVFNCGRFAVRYVFASDDPKIVDITTWEEWTS